MPEQVYCAAYFVILIFFQNPVYIYVSLSKLPSTTLAYVSYLLDRVSQAAFLVLWLMFADRFGRKTVLSDDIVSTALNVATHCQVQRLVCRHIL